jgi:hypothetical protein
MREFSYRTYRLDWREVEIEVRHCPDWLDGTAHFEIESLCCSPLPITGTGYRSLFVSVIGFSRASYGDVNLSRSVT